MTNINELLHGLNPAQLKAVQHPPQIPLQILAGPGSGKTKVLTMRIAHLITNCCIPPWAICAVTFTNKAANEMRERLVKLIGKERTAQIKMGTFHALCAMFLRRYAQHVAIEGNFTVCDAEESKKIIGKLLKQYKEILKDQNLSVKEGFFMSVISKFKAKGINPEGAKKKLAENDAMDPLQRFNRKLYPLEGELGRIIVEVYKEYERTLRESNSLDFDDLLLFGLKMFIGHKKASSWCQHVLVDEYQDTNTTQYELMRYIAQSCRCVTIVGDPDQSIYGWRSAEITNLANMQRDFPTTQQIYLEQNYRSTASILAVSMAFISQDKSRIQKTLNTTHPKGPLPVLRAFPIEQVEAKFIAAEIKRLVAFSGGMLNWNDFVVLLRFNALSRSIESALQKEGIPSRVLAGHKFFERMEIKDILAYLQLVDNPAFVPAFTRVVNIPSRTVGEKTIAELLHRGEQLKLSPLQVVERIVDGTIPDIKPPVKRKLNSFIGILRDLRKFANEGMSPSKLINALVELIHYDEHLRKTQPDHESRWDNVQELINFASEVETNMPREVGEMMNDAQDAAHEELWGDDLGEWDADQVPDRQERANQPPSDTPLRLFLQASMLSTDTETGEDDKNKEKVTISTCHAAKGLEWAVVMIPAVNDGVFPSSRAEDIEEELRLLYVACTRAQGMLYLTHTTTRMIAGESLPQFESEFVAAIQSDPKTSGVFSEELSSLTPEDRATLSRVLNRPTPDDAEVVRRVAEYERSVVHPVWGANAPFRDLPQESVNGYGVPIRYPPIAEQHTHRATKDATVAQQSRPQPQHDNLAEPPVFVASSLVHFNNVHRAGIVKNATTTVIGASSSRTLIRPEPVFKEQKSSTASPLASSSSRVVNAVAAKSQTNGSTLRGWAVQVGKYKGPTAENAGISSGAKGKAKAIPPSSQLDMKPPIQLMVETKKHSSSSSTRLSTASSHASSTVPNWVQREERSTERSSGQCITFPRSTAGSLRPMPVDIKPPKPSSSSQGLDQPSSSGTSVPLSDSSESVSNSPPEPSPVVGTKSSGVKRRLGMGRATGGYTNKKFKPLRPNT